MGLGPQFLGRREGINTCLFPPVRFITATVNLAMVYAAEWDSQFVAHLAPERPMLGKPKVMSVSRLATTYNARLLGQELNVGSVPDAPRLW